MLLFLHTLAITATKRGTERPAPVGRHDISSEGVA